MLVFIDESGDPGFKIAKGSDPVFVVGMVIFKNAADADTTRIAVDALHRELRHKPEFKFSKCSSEVRDAFFRGVIQHPFAVRALIVKKALIYSDQLRTSNDAFYNYFVKQLMNFDGGVLKNARIRIDGSGNRQFQRALCAYLRRELGRKIRDVRMVDSKRDALMQLSDMAVGAIARAYRDRDDAARWRNVLKSRIENIWEFR